MQWPGIRRVFWMRLLGCWAAGMAVLCLAAMPLAAIALPLSADKCTADQLETLPTLLDVFEATPPAESKTLGIPLVNVDNAPTLSPLAADQVLTEMPEIPVNPAYREYQRGSVSWYGARFNNRRTASGERFDMHALTAAHRTLPFGTIVRLRSMVNGYEVDVRINDRGPFGRSHVIDISRAAAKALDILSFGVHDVILMVPKSTLTQADGLTPAIKSRWHLHAPPKAKAR